MAADPASPVARDFAVETRLFECLAPRALALLNFRLGRFDEAAQLFRRLQGARGLSPEERQELEIKQRLAELRAKRRRNDDGALHGGPGAPPDE